MKLICLDAIKVLEVAALDLFISFLESLSNGMGNLVTGSVHCSTLSLALLTTLSPLTLGCKTQLEGEPESYALHCEQNRTINH